MAIACRREQGWKGHTMKIGLKRMATRRRITSSGWYHLTSARAGCFKNSLWMNINHTAQFFHLPYNHARTWCTVEIRTQPAWDRSCWRQTTCTAQRAESDDDGEHRSWLCRPRLQAVVMSKIFRWTTVLENEILAQHAVAKRGVASTFFTKSETKLRFLSLSTVALFLQGLCEYKRLTQEHTKQFLIYDWHFLALISTLHRTFSLVIFYELLTVSCPGEGHCQQSLKGRFNSWTAFNFK